MDCTGKAVAIIQAAQRGQWHAAQGGRKGTEDGAMGGGTKEEGH